MNIHDNFEKKLEYISMFNGVCLNIEERLKLEIALNDLHNQTKDEEIWFWGKIYGTESDYFIALGINYKDYYEFPEKKLYFSSTSNYQFALLPTTYDYHDNDFKETYLNPFTGNPNTIITKYKEDVDPEAIGTVTGGDQGDIGNQNPEDVNPNPNADLDDSQPEIQVAKVEKENFTEALKISYVVKCIDYETNVVPQGAFRLIPIHEIRRDQSWKGLKPEELRDFSKFHHFRPITNPKNKERVESDEAIFLPDLLDSISEDPVKHSWSIQLDSTQTICNIRSLLWPGYFAFHKSNTNIFGGVYFGYGIKNNELPFMI